MKKRRQEDLGWKSSQGPKTREIENQGPRICYWTLKLYTGASKSGDHGDPPLRPKELTNGFVFWNAIYQHIFNVTHILSHQENSAISKLPRPEDKILRYNLSWAKWTIYTLLFKEERYFV